MTESAGADLARVEKERDELQMLLDKFERHMSEVGHTIRKMTERGERSQPCRVRQNNDGGGEPR